MSRVPTHISEGLKSAIHEAMVEEKAPTYHRFLKAIGGAAISTAFILGAYVLLLKGEAFHHGLSFFVAFFLILLGGFYFYFKPEPHWVVRGHWSSWSYGGLFVLMGVLAGLQFIICPHFVLLHQVGHEGFSPLDVLARQYHHWGGLPGSKFLCGMTSSALSSLVVVSVFRKQFWGARRQALLKVVSLLLIAQSPALLVQIMDSHLRAYSYLWLLGSLAALILLMAILRFAFILKVKKRFHARNKTRF